MHCLKPHNASIQPPNDLSCNHTQVNPYMATPRRCRGYSSSNLLWGASLVQVACPLYNWQVVAVLVCPASTGTKASSHYIFTCGGHHLLQLAPMLDWALQLALVVFLPASHAKKSLKIVPSIPLSCHHLCTLNQGTKWVSYECLQTAHFVIHVHFIVISCTLPCISLIWVHHMSGL